ncbi:8594_t:CDS:2 [Cetraspora pellucida]|uniref:8594_t:CDS:1 n=1 Tax=Cetraspora pellucida TaxID=1433469 RepID=A0A9N9N881_9GLOM|nr:8594_t:CDS:2 [Cetraspora pellucida]
MSATKSSATKQYSIDRSTVSNILRDKDKYLHSQNIPVSQNILKTKALSIYKQLKDGDIKFLSIFEASNSWVFGFQ